MASTPVARGVLTDHWKENRGALDRTFTAADEALVDKLVPAGHPSTHGFTDPGYPVTGRFARVA